jgi:membrane fusion protein, multidrug efflux system
MKMIRNAIGLLVLAALAGGVWVLRFHPDWLKPPVEAEAEEKIETEVPVRTAKVVKTTLRRFVEGAGIVEPEPARGGRQAASAALASPVAGIVASVLCEAGQRVSTGTVLVQLDERLAKAAEEQAAAVLESAKAALAKLKATPRPEQLEVGQLGVDKARSGVDFAQRGYERQKALAAQQGTSEKSLQQAELELNAARNDLLVAQKQLSLLKSSPTPEEMKEGEAKVAEAAGAMATAKTQRSMLKIQAPLDATVVRLGANPGEAVDPTRVLVELVALDRLVVNAAIPADELPSLKLGQRVEVEGSGSRVQGPEGPKPEVLPPTTAPSFLNPEPRTPNPAAQGVCEGSVSFISPEVDRKTATVLVSISLPAEAGWRPGQFVRVRVEVERHADRLAVPTESVVQDEEGHCVVAVVSGEKAAQKPVRAGLQEGGLTEIEGEGLREGDVVVTAGAYGLPKESKVSFR